MKPNSSTKKTRFYFNERFPFASINALVDFCLIAFSYYGSLIVQTFLRRNMGERYFTPWFNLVILGWMYMQVSPFIERTGFQYLHRQEFNWSWIVSGALLLGFTIWRYFEIDRSLTSYDDTKFSLSDGETLRLWRILKPIFPFKKHPFRYYVVRYFEGGFVIILGWVLRIFEYTELVGQYVVGFGLSHIVFQYMMFKNGRAEILEKIDEKIMNEDMYDALVNEKSERGFRWAGPKLEDSEATQIIANSLIDGDTEKSSRVQ